MANHDGRIAGMPEEETRTCEKCGTTLPLSEFPHYKSPNTKKIVVSRSCRLCRRIAEQQRVINRRRGRPYKGKSLARCPEKLRRSGLIPKLWSYPLEERCYRNLRFLLKQYGLQPPSRGRPGGQPPQPLKTVPNSRSQELHDMIKRLADRGFTLEEVTTLLEGDTLPDSEMRECRKCHEKKPLSDFYTSGTYNKLGEPYYKHVCKNCFNDYMADYQRKKYRDNHEEILEYQRGYYKKHGRRRTGRLVTKSNGQNKPVRQGKEYEEYKKQVIQNNPVRMVEVTCHLPSTRPGIMIRGELRKRTLCGRLVTPGIVVAGPEDVSCEMCKKLAARQPSRT